MTEDSITLCTRLTRADVAGLIEALAEGLKEGVLTIQKSGSTLVMDVPKVIDFTVQGDKDDDRSAFTLEVSWRTKPLEVPDMDASLTCMEKPEKKRATAAKPKKAAASSVAKAPAKKAAASAKNATEKSTASASAAKQKKAVAARKSVKTPAAKKKS